MNSPEFYKNKVVLITGGSMGIGKELALRILQYGGKVIITGRNQERLTVVQKEYQDYIENLLIHNGDVANYEDNSNLMSKIIQRFGKLDVLINNAAMSTDFGELEIIDNKVVDEVINTNIKGSIFSSILAIPELKKTNGSILFVSTIASFWGLPAYSLYSLSKISLTRLTESLRTEYKETGMFIGIAYVGFSKNETDKRTLSYDGKYVKVAPRPKAFTNPRSLTVKLLLEQIAKRKPRAIHTFLGKLSFFMTRYLPSIANLIYRRIYHNQKKSMKINYTLSIGPF